MHKILFLPYNKTITCEDGETLLRAAIDAGVHVNASCGGQGVCGKCRIMIEEGAVDGGISDKLSKADQDKGYRLACLSKVKQDLTVRIPVESQVDADILNLHSPPRQTAQIQQINLEELKEKGLFLPPVEKKYVELPGPSAQDNLADTSRLINFLS